MLLQIRYVDDLEGTELAGGGGEGQGVAAGAGAFSSFVSLGSSKLVAELVVPQAW